MLSSERSGFNQAVFTHGEQSQVFRTVMLKVLFLVFAMPAVEMKGVVHVSEVPQSGCLQTQSEIANWGHPAQAFKFFIRITYLRKVREVFSSPISQASFLHPCWETISFEKHCWKHSPLIFSPSLETASSRKLLSF